MTGQTLWLAIGLVLIVEGLGPTLLPEQWRRWVNELSCQDNNILRRVGGVLVVSGLVVLYTNWG